MNAEKGFVESGLKMLRLGLRNAKYSLLVPFEVLGFLMFNDGHEELLCKKVMRIISVLNLSKST